jgi:phospholipid N-methyltransferase
MTNLEFLKEGIKNLKTVGTVTRTSKYVSQAMLDYIDFDHADFIVELGAGDGAITKHILKKLKPEARLMVFEVNPNFCERLNKLNDPRIIIIADGAEHIEKYMLQYDKKDCDAIISAIPFVVLPETLSEKILRDCKRLLVPNGSFVQIHYSLARKKMYEKIFGKVGVEFVPLNIPPAFVIYTKKVS